MLMATITMLIAPKESGGGVGVSSYVGRMETEVSTNGARKTKYASHAI